MGVFLLLCRCGRWCRGLPHARGGVSVPGLGTAGRGASSPRTWGCFRLPWGQKRLQTVFPTHVGVFLRCPACLPGLVRLPHARGGVSATRPSGGSADGSSPRTWGCFYSDAGAQAQAAVFPTHVGVFPTLDLTERLLWSLPHARGGVSVCARGERVFERSSPRTWGCFQGSTAAFLLSLVFPTHVGVFPFSQPAGAILKGLPHARGGVSVVVLVKRSAKRVFPTHVGVFPIIPAVLPKELRLPHARGGVSTFSHCPTGATLVFPPHVGVFPLAYSSRPPWQRLPHARGGVSFCLLSGFERFESSPRTWGCFQSAGRQNINSAVFPTHVGVFLLPAGNTETAACLPHARGGVSLAGRLIYIVCQSSPRTWGCFLLRPHTRHPRAVFPTHVGVFPSPGTGT